MTTQPPNATRRRRTPLEYTFGEIFSNTRTYNSLMDRLVPSITHQPDITDEMTQQEQDAYDKVALLLNHIRFVMGRNSCIRSLMVKEIASTYPLFTALTKQSLNGILMEHIEKNKAKIMAIPPFVKGNVDAVEFGTDGTERIERDIRDYCQQIDRKSRDIRDYVSSRESEIRTMAQKVEQLEEKLETFGKDWENQAREKIVKSVGEAVDRTNWYPINADTEYGDIILEFVNKSDVICSNVNPALNLNEHVNFGRFKILLRISTSDLSLSIGYIRKFWRNRELTSRAFSSPLHPHVLQHSVCWGTESVAVSEARENCDIAGFLCRLDAIMATYNSGSPFVTMKSCLKKNQKPPRLISRGEVDASCIASLEEFGYTFEPAPELSGLNPTSIIHDELLGDPIDLTSTTEHPAQPIRELGEVMTPNGSAIIFSTTYEGDWVAQPVEQTRTRNGHHLDITLLPRMVDYMPITLDLEPEVQAFREKFEDFLAAKCGMSINYFFNEIMFGRNVYSPEAKVMLANLLRENLGHLSGVIAGAFSWSRPPHGSAYWQDIYNKALRVDRGQE